jgi:hypothetical protein
MGKIINSFDAQNRKNACIVSTHGRIWHYVPAKNIS